MTSTHSQNTYTRAQSLPDLLKLLTRSPLAWPAGLRVLAVLPVLVLLWLAVWWASLQVAL